MTALIECVPNISEGRDLDVINACTDAVTGTPGAKLLDLHSDADHHRSVLTIAGDPEAVLEAAFRLTRVAASRIDLRQHTGAHPRMGATDVIPLVPLRGVSMAACRSLAEQLGERIWQELDLPVYLYAQAARDPVYAWLPRIRGRGFEALLAAGRAGTLYPPDFGPSMPHPTAGITAVGARTVLIAFNVLLESADITIADAIARTVRSSSGGLEAVQARGFLVGGRAQVSTNLLDHRITSPLRLFEAIEAAARELGVRVRSSELVGLAPAATVTGSIAQRILLDDDWSSHVLESRLRTAGLRDQIDV